MEPDSHTQVLTLHYLRDLLWLSLGFIGLIASTCVIHVTGKAVCRHVTLPKLPVIIRWLEYYLLSLGAFLFAAIVTRVTFDLAHSLFKT